MKLGEMLVRANLIDEIQLKVALKEQISSGEKLGSTLVSLGFMDENVLSAFLSKQMDIPCITIAMDFRLRWNHITPFNTAKEARTLFQAFFRLWSRI